MAPFRSVNGTPPALRPIFSNELLTSDASPFVRFLAWVAIKLLQD